MKVRVINDYICGLTVEQTIDISQGEELDTEIIFDGEVIIAGSDRLEFIAKLKELIEAYQI